MQNSLNQAIQEATKSLGQFEQKLIDIDKRMLEVSKKARVSVPGGTSSPQGASQANKNTTKINEQVNALLKEQDRLEKALIRQIAKKTAAFQKENKELVKTRLETQIINKVAKEDAILTSKLTTEKQKAQAVLAKLNREYDDLAIRQERFGDLTKDEILEMGRLQKEALKLNNSLGKVEQGSGRFQRGVGNYKSGFDGLGFSIAQLSREAPAFANSMQTGFMAISNNIPMLVDEITRLKVANVELAASGKPTVNILSRVGKAIFSLNGLLGIGITVLTVFGPKLIDWAFGMSEAEKATEEATKAIEEQNKQLKENLDLRRKQLSQATKFINAQNEALQSALTQSTGETVEQGLILVEIAERLSKIGLEGADAVKDENIAQQDRVVIANNLLEIERLRIKLEAERSRLSKVQSERDKIEKDFANGSISLYSKRLKLQFLGSESLKNTLSIQGRISQLLEANNTLTSNYVEIQAETNKSSGDELTILKGSITWYEQLIAKLEQKRLGVARNGEEWDIVSEKILKTRDELNGLVGRLEDYNSQLNTSFQIDVENIVKGDLSSIGELFDDDTLDLEKLYKEDTDKYKLYLKEKERLERESANVRRQINENLFDFFGSLSDGLFQRELEGYDQRIAGNSDYYDDLISNEENNEKQKEALEQERKIKETKLEDDRRKLENKAFIFKKLAAAAEIAINTAKSVAAIKAQAAILAANPVTAPLAALALTQIPGVITAGALAGGTVLAQSIPALKDGDLSGMHEGLVMINDAKGSNYREIIERKDGSLEMYSGRNKIINKDKSDRVHKAGTFEPSKILQNGLALSAIGIQEKIDAVIAKSNNKPINIGNTISRDIRRGFKGVRINGGQQIDVRELAQAIAMEIDIKNR